MFARKRIQNIIIESTNSYTELCEMGKTLGIDKSPYNERPGFHRHPYTTVYSMLFAPYKNKEIKFAEIGIASGGSVILWNNYFTNLSTRLQFFDRDQEFLDTSKSFGFLRSSFNLMDVSVDGGITRALEGTGEYDIIVDDSSHSPGDQQRIAREAFPFIKSGGYMIIEDINRGIPDEQFEKNLESILPQCSEAYFVMCEHVLKYSPGWNNDKMLVLVKK